MNNVFFSLKRAHQASLKVSRSALLPFGLTPARFDLLCAVLKMQDISQVDLARILGVSAPTVSRMVQSLASLDLVEKGWAYDHRIRTVSLTTKGLNVLNRALRSVAGSGFADLAERIATSWSHSGRRVETHARRVLRHLRWIRYAFGDTAIRFRSYAQPFDESRLRRPLSLVSTPPHLDEQLFEWDPGCVHTSWHANECDSS